MGVRIMACPFFAVEPDLDVYFRENVIGGPALSSSRSRATMLLPRRSCVKLVAEISQTSARARNSR